MLQGFFRKQPYISLGMTLHDPKKDWNQNVESWGIGRRLARAFKGGVVVSATEETARENPELLKLLNEQGAKVVVEEKYRFSKNKIENNHLQALHEAISFGSPWVMYGDFDRVCVDAVIGKGISRTVPELEDFLRTRGEKVDLVTLNRDRRFLTESVSRFAIEKPVVNTVSEVVGAYCDPLASYVVVRKEAAVKLIETSSLLPEMAYPATKWVLEALEKGMKVGGFNAGFNLGMYESPQLLDVKLIESRIAEDEQESGEFYRAFHRDSEGESTPIEQARWVLHNLENPRFALPDFRGFLYRYIPEADPSKSSLEGQIQRAKDILGYIGNELESNRLEMFKEKRIRVEMGLDRGKQELSDLESKLAVEPERPRVSFFDRLALSRSRSAEKAGLESKEI